MTSTIVPETRLETVEIWVSRDFDVYTHKVYENGVIKSAQVINAKRAAEIINSNPDGDTRGSAPVNFSPGAKQFTWIATICEEVEA